MSGSTITHLPDPSGFSSDPLTDLVRDGARQLIRQAVEAELAVLLERHAADRLEDGRARLVRHGHLPEREVLTGIGPVPVKVPRVRDRGAGEDRISFTPSILPRYLRKTKSVAELLPWLYLKGVSTGDFSEALAARLGPQAQGLSAATITRRDKPTGGTTMKPGKGVTSACAASSTSGRTGFISNPGWPRRNSAFW